MRFVQRIERPKGSLRWLRLAINRSPELLSFDGGPPVDWISPLAADDFAEYRDGAFLEKLGLDGLRDRLRAFWPASGGPQWDGLGRRAGQVILVEAKAHLAEFFSPPCAASQRSRAVIDAALVATQERLGAKPRSCWATCYYQYTNRLAHLHFLRREGVDAHLLLVGFVGDKEMHGPVSSLEWDVAYRCADYALGLPSRHALSPYVHHVHPDVSILAKVDQCVDQR